MHLCLLVLISAYGLVPKFICSGFEPPDALPSQPLMAVGARNLQPAGCAEALSFLS